MIAVAVPDRQGHVWAAQERQSERESMKIMLRAAIAVFSLGIGTAHAGDGDGNSATTLFTSIQNQQAAPAHQCRGSGSQLARLKRLARQSRVLTPAHRAKARGCSGCSRYRRLAKAYSAVRPPRLAARAGSDKGPVWLNTVTSSVQRHPHLPEQVGFCSSARITGPMRCRVTSQRRLPGSHTPPARCRMWAKSCGQRTATMRPNSANSAGPMRRILLPISGRLDGVPPIGAAPAITTCGDEQA